MGSAQRNPKKTCMELMGFAALYPSYETPKDCICPDDKPDPRR
jgi:hypothetical protein